LTDEDVKNQITACGSKKISTSSIYFIMRAYTDGICAVKSKDGQLIYFSGEDRQKCLDSYLAMIEAKTLGWQEILGKRPQNGLGQTAHVESNR
jgi:hypothetical protein